MIHWIIEKAREFQENIYFCFIDYVKAFDCVDHNKFFKRWEYQTTLPAFWETYMQVKKQQLKLDMKHYKIIYKILNLTPKKVHIFFQWQKTLTLPKKRKKKTIGFLLSMINHLRTP